MMQIDGRKAVLILETSKMLPVAVRTKIEKRVEKKTGHACVMLDGGITLAAGISPGELCEK